MNNGSSVNHANAGKKCIGITSPGNNSGELTSNGNFAAKAGSMLANDRIMKMKLNTISVLPFSHLFNIQYPKAATRQPMTLEINMPTGFAMFEKSAPTEDE